MPEPNLGKLIAVHSTSPAFLQRAAIVTGLSFIFFLAALIFYLARQNFLYFILATGFLIVQVFTMIGWWMQKRNAVSIYANGIVFRKRRLIWSDIEDVASSEDSGLRIVPKKGEVIVLPTAIQGLERIAHHVRQAVSLSQQR